MANDNAVDALFGRLARGLVVVGCLCSAVWSAAHAAELTVYSKAGGYEDVKFDLNNAILGRGLVIDYNGQVSAMLDRTGADVGSAKTIYKKAEYFAFCSAKLSRAMMEADAGNLGLCPFVVFIYETAAEPGEIRVGYRRLGSEGSSATKSALAAIEALLDGIAKEATQ